MKKVIKHFIFFEISVLTILIFVITISLYVVFHAFGKTGYGTEPPLPDFFWDTVLIHFHAGPLFDTRILITVLGAMLFYGILSLFPCYGFKYFGKKKSHVRLHTTFIIAMMVHPFTFIGMNIGLISARF